MEIMKKYEVFKLIVKLQLFYFIQFNVNKKHCNIAVLLGLKLK